MNVRLAIPDALFDLYVVHAGGDETQALAQMATQLDRFRMIRPMDRILVVGSKERAELEELLPNPLPQIKDAKDLLQRINALADLEIGGVRVKFTPRDLEAIARSAEKNALSVQEACQVTVDHMKQHFLSYVGDATARAAMLPVAEDTPDEEPDDTPAEPEPVTVDPTLEALRPEPTTPPPPAVVPKHPGASTQPHELPTAPQEIGRLLNPRPEEEDDDAALAASLAAPEPSFEERQAALRTPVPAGVRAPVAIAKPEEKIMPRRAQPKVHKRRKVVAETPARDGGDVRPPGWGAGGLAALSGQGGEE